MQHLNGHLPNPMAASFPFGVTLSPCFAPQAMAFATTPNAVAPTLPIPLPGQQQVGSANQRGTLGSRSGVCAAKHMEAEQRRRARISDSIDALKRLVPHQGRTNTAAFLAEVYDYIESLHSRIRRIEDSTNSTEQPSVPAAGANAADSVTAPPQTAVAPNLDDEPAAEEADGGMVGRAQGVGGVFRAGQEDEEQAHCDVDDQHREGFDLNMIAVEGTAREGGEPVDASAAGLKTVIAAGLAGTKRRRGSDSCTAKAAPGECGQDQTAGTPWWLRDNALKANTDDARRQGGEAAAVTVQRQQVDGDGWTDELPQLAPSPEHPRQQPEHQQSNDGVSATSHPSTAPLPLAAPLSASTSPSCSAGGSAARAASPKPRRRGPAPGKGRRGRAALGACARTEITPSPLNSTGGNGCAVEETEDAAKRNAAGAHAGAAETTQPRENGDGDGDGELDAAVEAASVLAMVGSSWCDASQPNNTHTPAAAPADAPMLAAAAAPVARVAGPANQRQAPLKPKQRHLQSARLQPLAAAPASTVATLPFGLSSFSMQLPMFTTMQPAALPAVQHPSLASAAAAAADAAAVAQQWGMAAAAAHIQAQAAAQAHAQVQALMQAVAASGGASPNNGGALLPVTLPSASPTSSPALVSEVAPLANGGEAANPAAVPALDSVAGNPTRQEEEAGRKRRRRAGGQAKAV
ncbi:hypothetical protein CLOM_g9275 [Closterium sp. NIES-68]|nr:hypothetical protein CLOM_g9275 [Closterium sp. NIES-68]GJP66628.1 hypothetical protein CLOP_g23542 [Closterium sp. NIES-67]